KSNQGTPIDLVIERNNSTDTLSVTTVNQKIGVTVMLPDFSNVIQKKEYSLAEAFPAGVSFGHWSLMDYASCMKFRFTRTGATEAGGLGAIGKLLPDSWDWQGFWLSTAVLSIMFAFMNIVPMPAVDGGHVMFLLYDIFPGRQPSVKFL